MYAYRIGAIWIYRMQYSKIATRVPGGVKLCDTRFSFLKSYYTHGLIIGYCWSACQMIGLGIWMMLERKLRMIKLN